MEPLVLCYISHPNGYLERLERQLADADIEFLKEVDSQFSWKRLVDWQGNMGAKYSDRLLIFVGGWDTLLLGSKREILEQNINVITFTGDKLCWPDHRIMEYEEKGARAIGPWRYVNTGPMSGPGWQIARAVAWGNQFRPLVGDDKMIGGSPSGTDMRFWTDFYLRSPFPSVIDYECRIGQTVLHEIEGDFSIVNGRLRNNRHGTLPIFLHLNGRSIAPEGLK